MQGVSWPNLRMIGSSVGLEFGGASFGDARLSKRLERIGAALVERPEASFPEAMRSEGQLEGLYRFINNNKVCFDKIRAPHIEQTVARCREQEDVLILHDTTSLEFSGDREGLGRLETSAFGFFLHASLAVTLDRTPLGVLGAENLVRKGAKRKNRSKRGIRKDPNRESLRWGRAVEECEKALDSPQHVIHIMDREGDNYDLISQLCNSNTRFIIRAAHNRCLVGETKKLRDLALNGKCRLKREVQVGRHVPFLEFKQKIHPEREARKVTLNISAISVELKRGNNFAPGSASSLKMNIVTAIEAAPPAGRKAICWHLLTSEPIKTNKEVEKVIDAYRARWVVEELFKALKTGCRFERRQLESFDSIENALAIFLPIACRILALRASSRSNPEFSCTALTEVQLLLLRHHTKRKMSKNPTNGEAFLALAELGGHLQRNGSPGWLVLGRAMDRLIILEDGYRTAKITQKM